MFSRLNLDRSVILLCMWRLNRRRRQVRGKWHVAETYIRGLD